MTSAVTTPLASSAEERAYYALNRKVYPWFAPFYDPITSPFLRTLRGEVVRAAGPRAGSRVLDVATGTGALAFAFAEAGADVTGVDIQESMLRIARKKRRLPNLSFVVGDATELAFPDAHFDISSISFALHEMPFSIRSRVLRQMARVTKPDGRLVIVDYGLPERAWAKWLAFHLIKLYERDHYAEFVGSDWRALLEGAGIEIREDRALRGGNARLLIAQRARHGAAH